MAVIALFVAGALYSGITDSLLLANGVSAVATVKRVYFEPSRSDHTSEINWSYYADLSWPLPGSEVQNRSRLPISPDSYKKLTSGPKTVAVVYSPSASNDAAYLAMDENWFRGQANFQYFVAAILSLVGWFGYRLTRWYKKLRAHATP
jgi:hypothetical protein